LPAIRGALAPSDPRSVATLAAVEVELCRDGYAYRFRQDDRPLEDAEGAFLLCGFLMALATDQQGRDVEARAWFERNRAACGPPGLFTEEFDVGQRPPGFRPRPFDRVRGPPRPPATRTSVSSLTGASTVSTRAARR
jgi:GH15 family glucan-1,4-alpha-glucosidase